MVQNCSGTITDNVRIITVHKPTFILTLCWGLRDFQMEQSKDSEPGMMLCWAPFVGEAAPPLSPGRCESRSPCTGYDWIEMFALCEEYQEYNFHGGMWMLYSGA